MSTGMPADALVLPDLAAIRAAHARIRPYIHRTPVLTSRSLDEAAGARLYFKCENLQKVGAFKARGAARRRRPMKPSASTRWKRSGRKSNPPWPAPSKKPWQSAVAAWSHWPATVTCRLCRPTCNRCSAH